ncbi:hypothetical protein SUGI_0914740 [Cryptomeria japonica]|uniref:F-box/kelch-repeat protein At5g15710 n=1 Tax=Cryptomeria japonica TaxID=3369 RepID=UPI002414B6E5|nr:F-box/kelch-repeat protein At5g15710 [Cryptomeria japonica]GLJ43883.1 hypothetical protein SUGI_0914740 [Cryptomeria japonica]
MALQQVSCKSICLYPHHDKDNYTEEKEVGHSQNYGLLTDLPKDLLGHILSRTSVDNVIRSSSVCRDWELYISSKSFMELWRQSCRFQGPPWLFALSTYNCRDCCSAYNPVMNKWYSIPPLFLPQSLRIPVAAIGGFLLVKGSSTVSQHLAVCNPISKQWRNLPPLHKPRSSSLISVIERRFHSDGNNGNCSGFQIIVAGGRSQDANGYEPSIEMYDSLADSWNVVGEVPCEYAVRLALWTPNDTVYCNGTIYCLTSARPYSIIAFNSVTGVWSEVMVPRGPHLLCSFLVQRRDKLTLVGGVGSPRDCKCLKVWELDEDGWLEIESMPGEFFNSFLGGKTDFDYKFAGNGDFLYFFKDSQSQMLVCELSSQNHKTSWRWIPGCSSVGSQFSKCSIRGMFIQPRLDVSDFC